MIPWVYFIAGYILGNVSFVVVWALIGVISHAQRRRRRRIGLVLPREFGA